MMEDRLISVLISRSVPVWILDNGGSVSVRTPQNEYKELASSTDYCTYIFFHFGPVIEAILAPALSNYVSTERRPKASRRRRW